MGAWIEMSYLNKEVHEPNQVAPFMGAWIEMGKKLVTRLVYDCRTLHGCVD